MKDFWRQAVLVLIISMGICTTSAVHAAKYVEITMAVLPNPVGDDDLFEYIALSNDTTEEVDLTGWILRRVDAEGDMFEEILSFTIPPETTVNLCANVDNLTNGDRTCIDTLPFQLVNNLSRIELVSPFGLLLVYADWSSENLGESDEPSVSNYAGLTAEYEIGLDALETSTYFESGTVSFSGTAHTPESETQAAKILVYANSSCEGESVSSHSATLTPFEDYYTFEDTFTAGGVGSYSIKAGLVDDGEEEIFIESACQSFEVEADTRPEGTLIIEKRTEGFEGEWSFDFSGSAGNFVLSNEVVDEGPQNQKTMSVPAGELTIAEALKENWQMTDVTCESQIAPEASVISFDSDTQTFMVNLLEEDSVYCVVINNYTPPPQGELVVIKEVTGFDGEWSFDFTGIDEGFTLTNSDEVERNEPWMEVFSVLAGEVTVSERVVRNWQMANVFCSFENSTEEEDIDPVYSFDIRNASFVVEVPENTTVYCTVTNNYSPRRSGGSGTRVKNQAIAALPAAPVAPVVALTTTAPKCEPLLTSYLHIGWNNDVEQVKKLQGFLSAHGSPVAVTGFFGPLTEAAVKNFQSTHMSEVLSPWGIIESTGFVFKTTRHKINNMNCLGSEGMPVL